MPQSLARVVLYVVFSTKNRAPFLKDPELRARLHAYMAGALQAAHRLLARFAGVRVDAGADLFSKKLQSLRGTAES